MRKTTITMAGFIAGLLVVAACGGIKLGLDQETIDAAECIADHSKCKDSSDSADAESDGTDSTAAADNDESDSENGIPATGGPSDTSGGVEGFDGYGRDSAAYFMGTWSRKAYDLDYSYSGQNQKCGYAFPPIVRGYSHDGVIDFENSGGWLQWIASIYPDETFDFEAHFLDRFGRMSVTVECTCEMVPGYGKYYPDEINCICLGDDDEAQCLLYYEKLSGE